MRSIGLAVTLVLATLVGLPASSAASPRDPMPLQGAPLRGATGLKLLVADNPPRLLDVDTGRVTRLRGAPNQTYPVVWVANISGLGAVVMAGGGVEADAFGVSRPAARAVPLGKARQVWAAEGRAVWLQRSAGRAKCSLRKVGLNGRRLRGPRPFPCVTLTDGAGPGGVVVGRTRLVDPTTGRTLFKARRGVVAVGRRHLVLDGPGKQFTLLDRVTGSETRLEWPSILDGMDAPAVDPQGRYVALGFADPAWVGAGKQVLDVWLLDTDTAALTQLPSMPAFVSLKRTSMAWTDDGRLVLLAERRRRMVALWRPGQPQLAVKQVRLPEPTSGSDSFAPLE
jgi:hypothetical protein